MTAFCLNKNLVAFNAIRITIDAFLLLVSIAFGVLKKLCFYQDLTNMIGISCFFCLKNFIFKKWVFVLFYFLKGIGSALKPFSPF